MSNLRPWSQSGKPDVVLAEGHGKSLIKRFFVNPVTNEEQDFFLFGQNDWSVVLAVTDEGNVLVTRQYKHGCNKVLDELPAGTADFNGETPEGVMRRELLQETGYEAGTVIALVPQWIATGSSPTRFHPFLALGCKKVRAATYDVNEQIEWRAVHISEWLDMVRTGQIEEPSAICATMLALEYLGVIPVP